MGNRSDRRLANLTNPLALEAVVPIRTRRADSIMARSKSQSSSQRPYIRMQPASAYLRLLLSAEVEFGATTNAPDHLELAIVDEQADVTGYFRNRNLAAML